MAQANIIGLILLVSDDADDDDDLIFFWYVEPQLQFQITSF
jgi:hypothetical protein